MSSLRTRLLSGSVLLATLMINSAGADVRGPLFDAAYVSFNPDLPTTNAAVADLDSDGHLDVAATSWNWGLDPKVSVFLGDGNGTLVGRRDYVLGGMPFFVQALDLNGDGSLDLLVADNGFDPDYLGGLTVLPGIGHGDFGSPVRVSVGTGICAPVVADVNGDGNIDIVFTSCLPQTGLLLVMVGKGDGTFAAPTRIATLGVIVSIAAGDLNGDGRADLVLGDSDLAGPNRPGQLATLLSQPDGSYHSVIEAIAEPAREVALVDLDLDGRLDLLWLEFPSGRLRIRLASGAGTFGPPSTIQCFEQSGGLLIARVDADGIPDIIVSNNFDSQIYRGLGSGAYSFYAAIPGPAAFGGPVALGDFHEDGNLDFVGVGFGLNLTLNNGDGSFGAARRALGGARSVYSVAIGKLDRDAIPDLAISFTNDQDSPPTLGVTRGNGGGTFQEGVLWPFPEYSIATGDFNRDGHDDVVGTSSILLGRGDGSFDPSRDIGVPGSNQLQVADFNSDGRKDIATIPYARGYPDYLPVLNVLLGNGDGTFSTPISKPIHGGYVYGLTVGDLNRDGRPDCVLVYADSVIALLGLGDGQFAVASSDPSPLGASSAAIGDVNGDGRADLAISGWLGADVLYGDGNGAFRFAQHYAMGGVRSVSHSVTLEDLDGDGILDLAMLVEEIGLLAIRLGKGDGTFGSCTGYGTAAAPYYSLYPHSMTAGDLNGDGMLDFVIANEDNASILINRATPIPVDVTLMAPATLNVASQGRWIALTLQPPSGFSAGDFEIGSIHLVGNVAGAAPVPVDRTAPSQIADSNGDHVSDLTVRFSRSAVESAISEAPAVRLTITGRIADRSFGASGQIRVVRDRSARSARSESSSGVEFSLQSIRPNPSFGVLEIEFGLDSGEPTRVEMFDVAGRKILSREVGALGPGLHSIRLDRRLTPGLYLVRLSQGIRERTRRAVVVQ